MYNILVIDDELAILTALKFALEDSFNVYCTPSVPEGLELLSNKDIDLVLLDQYLGEYSGLEVLQTIKNQKPGTLVIAMTAYGSIENSIEAIQRGAYYYITKPLDINGLKILINKALDYKNLSNRVEDLTKQINHKLGLDNIVASSKAMDEVFKIIERVKDLDINVLVTGESGTGKELIARAIHNSSKRASEALEIINCAAIPYNLLESELFGYEKGAFTGANQRYKGKFELAHKGTIFLDEIGEMDIQLQAKLLRVIQEKTITPLGSEKSIPVDFRLIAATNKNLAEEVKKGRFREDLFFRLNVISINTPPLRERKEDIPALAKYFMKKYSDAFNKEVSGISKSAIVVLEKHTYPGNVRELENIIERAVALTNNDIIDISDLPKEVVGSVDLGQSNELVPIYVGDSLIEAERKLILATLKYHNGNKRKTAKTLGMSERHLYTKIKDYNLEEES
ncbi:Transcriptional regulatory protein zraR [Proteiniborus sp. DW1]|uniref:sigma-54-dependent transcriptional regulator n=1 Tax=Proteiniborus sp. DW1 TaxID=1889883 RepID=UPI00092E03EF|nr:sigma-54 dependent transcriptional regulator [Proteiniborus sp. DW1]SCG82062.1 Transcriptional regulatory protein zraR [Proteiniborus sp. DW1]